MTAVPIERGTGVELICDGCGTVTPSDGYGLHDAEVVYVAVASTGWTGTAFARGPHHCPSCTAVLSPAGSRTHPSKRTPNRPSSDRVILDLKPAAAIVRVAGDVDLDVADDLWAALDTAATARRTVVVDLTEAGTIDSTGLAALVRGRNAARRRRGELVLAGPSRFLQTVLRTMRLNATFPAFRSVEHAVSATRNR